jgi:hypothetical protein
MGACSGSNAGAAWTALFGPVPCLRFGCLSRLFTGAPEEFPECPAPVARAAPKPRRESGSSRHTRLNKTAIFSSEAQFLAGSLLPSSRRCFDNLHKPVPQTRPCPNLFRLHSQG